MNAKRLPYRYRILGTIFAAVLIVSGLFLPAGGASAQSGLVNNRGEFTSPAFRQIWERTDLPVAQGKVSRTWLWGPGPGPSLSEPFKEGPSGQHLVQYFDKARMELNGTNLSPSDPYYVTNGLLVVEMISGQVQTGVNTFEPIGANNVQIAGDFGSNAPTYAALQVLASAGLSSGDHPANPLPIGSIIQPYLVDQAGDVRPIPGGTPPATVRAATYVSQTRHNIPDVFWNYMNSQAPVYQNGAYVNGSLMNWVSALGYPITEPYWTQIRVGTQDRLVLFQAFQRRLLTYSPQNPQGWQVEMANVGTQYYTWRYQSPGITCQNVPVRGFGRVWADHRNVQTGLGCPAVYPPYNHEQSIDTAYQTFEHGTMLWTSRQDYTLQKIIYVFFDDGTFQQFEDTWKDGEPANAGLTPPPGLYEPQRGFGKVWREGTGARVRERLGWATQPEQGAKGAYQRFQNGEMYWTGTVNKIYVLYGTVLYFSPPSPGPGINPGPLHYEVYSDTFQP